jgi:DNA-directed RNA polymerase specialized sigma24 family protein
MDDTAFLFELNRVENKLMGYAMSLTRYCEDDAQELFQATVVRAYLKKELFTPGTANGCLRVLRNCKFTSCKLGCAHCV